MQRHVLPHEKAVDELKKLYDIQKAHQNEGFLKAMETNRRSFDEIMGLLQGRKDPQRGMMMAEGKMTAAERKRMESLGRRIEKQKEWVFARHHEYNAAVNELWQLLDERYPEKKKNASEHSSMKPIRKASGPWRRFWHSWKAGTMTSTGKRVLRACRVLFVKVHIDAIIQKRYNTNTKQRPI